MSLLLTGIGTAVPLQSIPQGEASRLWASLAGVEREETRIVRALYRRSGVKKRHGILLEDSGDPSSPTQSFFEPARTSDDKGPTTQARMERFEFDAPVLARRAAEAALHDAEISPSEVTHLVTVSCTGFFAPGLDTRLVDLLGLPATVERTHVGFMGCHGALNGLRVASASSGADPAARVLVSSVELCTLHMSYEWDPDLLVANSLFGDGAAAVVGVGLQSPSPEGSWHLSSSGTCRLPDSAKAMSWRIGNHGFLMTLSTSVPDIIQNNLHGWLEEWLGGQGLGLDQIATWAVHPGGPRILTAVENALELTREATAVSRSVLSEFGNMSSATILFVLDRLRRSDAPRPCVALAFGPGLVAEAALFL